MALKPAKRSPCSTRVSASEQDIKWEQSSGDKMGLMGGADLTSLQQLNFSITPCCTQLLCQINKENPLYPLLHILLLMGRGIEVGFCGGSAGSAMLHLQQKAPSTPMWGCTTVPAAIHKQLKLLSKADKSLITFSTLSFSIFISVEQANAAFAEVLKGNFKSHPAPPFV